MAESLRRFADALEGAEDFDAALHTLIQDSLRAHQRIIFNGNGYDQSWVCLLYTSSQISKKPSRTMPTTTRAIIA